MMTIYQKNQPQSALSSQSVTIHAPANEVWRALVRSETLKPCLLEEQAGRQPSIAFIPEKLLRLAKWKSLSGFAAIKGGNKKVRYTLEPDTNGTRVTLTEVRKSPRTENWIIETFWETVLDGLKTATENIRNIRGPSGYGEHRGHQDFSLQAGRMA
jgi:hypothetical protein